MVMNAAIQFVHEQLTNKKKHPKFKAGDNVTVNYKITEGGKERIQSFRGDVLKIQSPYPQDCSACSTIQRA